MSDILRPNSMKAIPKEERPYEKCLLNGAQALSDAELLAVILRTGAQGESALELSRKVLSCQGDSQGLLGIYHMSISDLMKIRGVGTVKAVQIKCIAELSRRIARAQAVPTLSFTNPSSIAAYYMEEMRHQEQEILRVLMLNTRSVLIHEEVISKGTVRASLISPREIFISALRHRAVSIILLHNHPSGVPDPSNEDILLTKRVMEAGHMIGIELLDHIIIGDMQAFSMREQGIIPDPAAPA
jgi:DNA repair protein RadC